jgi:hypothetical protein
LGDVVSDAPIATRGINGDGEYFVFVGLEEKLKGSAVALLARFDYPFIDKLLSHHHQKVRRPAKGVSSKKNSHRLTQINTDQSAFIGVNLWPALIFEL